MGEIKKNSNVQYYKLISGKLGQSVKEDQKDDPDVMHYEYDSKSYYIRVVDGLQGHIVGLEKETDPQGAEKIKLTLQDDDGKYVVSFNALSFGGKQFIKQMFNFDFSKEATLWSQLNDNPAFVKPATVLAVLCDGKGVKFKYTMKQGNMPNCEDEMGKPYEKLSARELKKYKGILEDWYLDKLDELIAHFEENKPEVKPTIQQLKQKSMGEVTPEENEDDLPF